MKCIVQLYRLSFRTQGGIYLRLNHFTDASCVGITSSGVFYGVTTADHPCHYHLSFRTQGGIYLRLNHFTDASCVSMTSSGVLFGVTTADHPYHYRLSFRTQGEFIFASIIADASCVSMTSSGILFGVTAADHPYYYHYRLSFRTQGGIHLRFNHCRCFLRRHNKQRYFVMSRSVSYKV